MEENPTKFRLLDGNDLDREEVEGNDSTRFSDEDLVESSSSQEQCLDLGALESSTEPPFSKKRVEDEAVSLPVQSYYTDIDSLYAKLSMDFQLRAEQQTSYPRADDDNSSSEGKSTVSEKSVIWSSEEENIDSDSSDDNNPQDRPIFEGSEVTCEEHLMAIMSLAARHNLNQAQLTDLIEVIKMHCPKGGLCVSSGKALYKEITGDIDINYHDVCEDCSGLFPEDCSVYRCSTTGCSG